ncbi:hypothetical protein M426DRAFT_227441 [Hypoxylon sp. CI-4A]|nr:hypothetical protein M426DRAFT_227441 [Hypoxylon sp. CI-4A]
MAHSHVGVRQHILSDRVETSLGGARDRLRCQSRNRRAIGDQAKPTRFIGTLLLLLLLLGVLHDGGVGATFFFFSRLFIRP